MSQTDIERQHLERVFHGPAWRHLWAARCAASADTCLDAAMDRSTRSTVDFLRVGNDDEAGPAAAGRRHPTIAAAFYLHGEATAWERFQLSILGDLPSAEIAARLQVQPEVLAMAETLFFDLTGMREATAWMACHVFLPPTRADNLDLAARMKIAFHGGRVATRALLDAQDGLPLEEAQRQVHQEVLLHAKLQAALSIELTRSSALEFLKLFTQYDLARKDLELQREKFRHECRRTPSSGHPPTASDAQDRHGPTDVPGAPQPETPDPETPDTTTPIVGRAPTDLRGADRAAGSRQRVA